MVLMVLFDYNRPYAPRSPASVQPALSSNSIHFSCPLAQQSSKSKAIFPFSRRCAACKHKTKITKRQINLLPLIQHNANLDFIFLPTMYLQDVRSNESSSVSSRGDKFPLQNLPDSEAIQDQVNSPFWTILFDSLLFLLAFPCPLKFVT